MYVRQANKYCRSWKLRYHGDDYSVQTQTDIDKRWERGWLSCGCKAQGHWDEDGCGRQGKILEGEARNQEHHCSSEL